MDNYVQKTFANFAGLFKCLESLPVKERPKMFLVENVVQFDKEQIQGSLHCSEFACSWSHLARVASEEARKRGMPRVPSLLTERYANVSPN